MVEAGAAARQLAAGQVRQRAIWAVVGLGALTLPLWVRTPFYLHVATLVLLYALMGTAWNILGGYAGQVSLGHAVYFGAGAYTSTLLLVKLGWSPWVGMAAGAAVAVALAWAVGYPTFRLRGHYYAIATIALGEILFTLVTNWEWAGGAVGLFLPIEPDSLWRLQWRSRVPYYYLALGLLAGALALVRLLEGRRTGYYWRAIREDEEAARAAGIPVVRYKLYAAALSAAFTALAGTFYAQYSLYIDPPSVLALDLSIQICLVAVLGGVGTLPGPVVGAAVLVPLSEGTRGLLGGRGSATDLVVYGLLIMVIAALEPGGLMALWRRRQAARRARAAAGAGVGAGAA